MLGIQILYYYANYTVQVFGVTKCNQNRFVKNNLFTFFTAPIVGRVGWFTSKLDILTILLWQHPIGSMLTLLAQENAALARFLRQKKDSNKIVNSKIDVT